jgi:hypothetical protein
MIQQSARYPMDSISLALSSNSMVARIVKRSLALIALTLATACKHDGKSEDLKSPAVDRFGDPAYEVVNVGTYNYTRNDIYDVYILQPGSDDIDRASRAVGGLAPDKDAVNWQGIGIMATLAWDWRWRTPKRFDLIWLNVFDRKAYESAANYNAYKSRETAPGSAWCRLGNISAPLPFQNDFWSRARQSPEAASQLKQVKGFIAAYPVAWIKGENVRFEYPTALVADNDAPPGAGDTAPHEMAGEAAG